MAAALFLLLSAVCFQQALCADYIKFEDCGRDPNRAIKIKEVSITPHPVVLPGTITVHFSAEAVRTFGQNPISMDVSINKTVLFRPQIIPCISQVGTCHYDDVCGLLTEYKTAGCPTEIAGTGLPCFCPFQKGVVTLQSKQFVVKELNAIYNWLASGQFQARVQLQDSVTKQEVGCLYAQLQIGKSSGFLFN